MHTYTVPQLPLTLKVSLPINVFIQSKVSDPKNLLKRFCQMPNTLWPNGWCIEEITEITSSSRTTAVGAVKKSFDFGIIRLSLVPDGSWTIQVDANVLQLPREGMFLPALQRILSISVLLSLLKKLDSCILCPGNPDDKFHAVRDRRKGKFSDVSGSKYYYSIFYF